ncbi:hypothetical protein QJS10_CPB17g00986 [Acorus calamus]|uniref:Uncharacterized protein n=1 Tax=Acorus calamus TaxID=4465 RepID=A0AAV9CVE9_ACOCL|nr:hypothetical protein QJS10_CPB17g00986 [Acorus calamus]
MGRFQANSAKTLRFQKAEKKSFYSFKAIIESIDNKREPYYNACNNCYSKVDVKEDGAHCYKCNMSSVDHTESEKDRAMGRWIAAYIETTNDSEEGSESNGGSKNKEPQVIGLTHKPHEMSSPYWLKRGKKVSNEFFKRM